MPGYANSPGLDSAIEFAINEVFTLERAGFTSALLENEGDRPHSLKVSEEYRQNVSRLVKAVKSATKLPVGLEILYDMVGTVQAGIDAHADFVRLDVFTDDTEVKWGVVRECTEAVTRLREQAPNFFPQIWADVHVKHGRNISGRSLAESARLAVKHGASALIVTGTVTGEPPHRQDCEEMQQNSGELPVYVGSGFSEESASTLRTVCDGAVVASALQVHGRFEEERCKRLVEFIMRQRS
jgi:membrane complex biogenesis BtpA family protein